MKCLIISHVLTYPITCTFEGK